MPVLRYRERTSEEPQTFGGVVVGDVVRVVLYWKRNHATPMVRTAIDAVARPTRVPGEFKLTRMGAESAKVEDVPLGEGIATEPVYLVGIPEAVLNEWMRKTG